MAKKIIQPTLENLSTLMERGEQFKVQKKNTKTRRYKGGKLVLNDENKRIQNLINLAKEEGKQIKDVLSYFTIAAPPSLKPIKTYCDITGLPTHYKSPHNQIRYYNTECYSIVKSMPAGVDQQYLALRGANVILK